MIEKVEQKTHLKTKVALILFISISLGTLFFLFSFIPNYIIDVFSAIIAFLVAILMQIYWKQRPYYFILLLVIGIFFLASGMVEYAYDTVISPLPTSAQIEFSRIMRPNQISRGLSNAGIGFAFVMLFFHWLKLPQALSEKKFYIFFMLCFGIYLVVSGISSIIEGFSRL